MVMLEGLMHRKVNWFIAAGVLIVLAVVAAWAISARAFGPMVGLEVITPPVKCVINPQTGTCPNCPVCTATMGSACASVFEIKARYLSGQNVLAGGTALCTAQITPPNGGTFRSGSRCLGGVYGTGPQTLFNFGCYR